MRLLSELMVVALLSLKGSTYNRDIIHSIYASLHLWASSIKMEDVEADVKARHCCCSQTPIALLDLFMNGFICKVVFKEHVGLYK